MILGYCCISKLEPLARLEAQADALEKLGAQTIYRETVGLSPARPALERAIEAAQKGDVIIAMKPYRIARSTRGVLAVIDRLNRKGAGIRIVSTPIDTSTTTGRMILGSAPVWSLGISPWRSVLRDFALGRIAALTAR